jgi:hypothetical protein
MRREHAISLVDRKYVQHITPGYYFGDVGVMLAEISTRDLPNTKQVCYVLDHDFRYVGASGGAVLHCVTEV